jgi:hypothetical protein
MFMDYKPVAQEISGLLETRYGGRPYKLCENRKLSGEFTLLTLGRSLHSIFSRMTFF